MIDLYNSSNRNNTQFYYSSAIWYKPRGVSNILITAIGAGGGGGGGFSAAAGSAKGGGGGGASGGISRLYLPAMLVPDLLSITVGLGSAGGAATIGGTRGGDTIIDVTNSANASQTYFLIASGGGQGGAGTGAARGTAGAAAAVSSTAAALFSNLGHSNFVAGMAGALGGLTALNSPGAGILYAGSTPFSVVTGGAGGGGRSGAGGSVAGSGGIGLGEYPTIAGGSSASLLNGVGGYYRVKSFYSLGGGGGFGIDASPGGDGGVGGPGSGGGGGGAGTTGGSGGNGGNGLVIITCW